MRGGRGGPVGGGPNNGRARARTPGGGSGGAGHGPCQSGAARRAGRARASATGGVTTPEQRGRGGRRPPLRRPKAAAGGRAAARGAPKGRQSPEGAAAGAARRAAGWEIGGDGRALGVGQARGRAGRAGGEAREAGRGRRPSPRESGNAEPGRAVGDAARERSAGCVDVQQRGEPGGWPARGTGRAASSERVGRITAVPLRPPQRGTATERAVIGPTCTARAAGACQARPEHQFGCL